MSLAARLRARIAAEGPIAIDVFMAAALGDAAHGYYRHGTPIGRGGDFTTAPEISQIFGELIGLWCADAWARAGAPRPVNLVEMGPGRGTLMADALRAVAKVAPDFAAAIRLHLVEINPAFRALQARALAATAPAWHEALATVPDGPMLLVANEFFDALPIRQLVRGDGAWRERRVMPAGEGFAATIGEPVTLDPAHDRAAPDGAILEIAPAREAVAQAIGTRIARGGIAALIIDYGPQGQGLGDTLQAIKAGAPADPFADPGAADLTAHVDFAALARAAQAGGARAFGPVPQGNFLARLGLATRLAMLARAATPDRARDLVRGAERLIDPAQMGSLFKAIAIAPAASSPPAGFE